MTYGRTDFAAEPDVSHETLAAFDAWHTTLRKWNKCINLVSPAALDGFWQRHALDSWQLQAFMPSHVEAAVDLGSGAGFPGLAIGIALKQTSKESGEGRATLVESAGKKATFLRTVARELDLPVTVSSERAEALPAKAHDLVTARAFAPLPRLLNYSHPFWSEGTLGLFLKGERFEDEIEEARTSWRFDVDIHPSRSSDFGKVLAIRNLAPIAD